MLKIIGNFGVSFVSPLVGTNALGIPLEKDVLVALVCAGITTSLSVFNEVRVYGESNGYSH